MNESRVPAPALRRASPDPRLVGGRPGVTCIGATVRRSGALRAYAVIHLAKCRQQIPDVPIFEGNGRRWAGMPTKPVVDSRTGHVERDADGKIKYVPTLIWGTPELQRAFSDAVARSRTTTLACSMIREANHD